MAKNLGKYAQAWILRKEGKTYKEIGGIMHFTAERARILVNYVVFALRRKNKDHKELTAMLRK